MVEEFKEKPHFKIISDWYKGYGLAPIPLDCIPTFGLIDPKVAAGFLIVTDCNLGLLEFFISNPKSLKADRDKVLDQITADLISYGKSIGITNFKADTNIESIKKRAIKHGFEYIGDFSNLFLTKRVV